jgi:hypothetical protein
MKQNMAFNNLGLLILATFTVGACSPLAPSVSKLSNASAHPTDGSSQSNDLLNTPSSLMARSSAKSNLDAGLVGTQKTRVVPAMSVNLSLDDMVALDLKRDSLSDFASHGTVNFQTSSDDIKGHESALMKSKVIIYLIVDADASTIKKLHLDEAAALLSWHAASSPKEESHWELSIDKPNNHSGDPVTDVGAQDIRDTLMEHLVKITVEFQNSN